MELQNIGTTTTWNEAASRINSNNQKIGTELMKLGSATYKNKGYFKTLSDLQSAFPTASAGSKAYVGPSYPYAIYLWENNSWVNSGATGGDDSLDTKADVVEISNYLTEGTAIPYPGVYMYGSNFPHVVSFRRSEEGTDVWYLAFCLTHLPPNSPIGYYYIFYRQDHNDYKYKFVKMVNWSDNFNDEWYKLGAKVFGEDLQETKQDKLTNEQIANIAAVPNKVDLVEISSINAESSAGTRFPFPAMYSYYGGTLPHAAQFSQNGISYVVLCLWHDASGTPASGQYALFKRTETNPTYIEFLRYVAEGDEFFTICQKQFHDDLPAKVTTLQSAVTTLQSEVAALKAIINEITTKE